MWELDEETWPESVRGGGDEIDVLVHDEDHEAVVRASVAVDDDPEETVGRETVGRTRRGRKIRGLEEFRKNLPPFWKNLNRPCPSRRNFFEDNSIYFES